MDDTTATIYCLCEHFLKATHRRDDPQLQLSDADVMAVPLRPRPPSLSTSIEATSKRGLHAIEPSSGWCYSRC
jgi:hypothetical protein